MEEVKVRQITKEDLSACRYWKLPDHQYHDFNGPYFKKQTLEEIEAEIR